MKSIQISDFTMKFIARQQENSLSFREKIELSKLLDKLGLAVIETEPIVEKRTDSLLIKSICFAVSNSIVAVPVNILDGDSVEVTWNALKEAKQARLQVNASVSTVQMEYFYSKKPAAVLGLIEERVKQCKQYCDDVEFIADDASRADQDFINQAIDTAVKAGANTITICETEGSMLPDEFYKYIVEIKKLIPEGVRLGVSCSNSMYVADACAMSAVQAGVDEVKVVSYGDQRTSIEKIVQMLRVRGEEFGVKCDVRVTELQRSMAQIRWICTSNRGEKSPFDDGVRDDNKDLLLNIHDNISAVSDAVSSLGYDLSAEDLQRVYDAFVAIASHKDSVSYKELDAIVASSALQVPPTYKLSSYMINSSNIVSASAHIKLEKDYEILEAICIGDGPIDAAFLAIEKIIGTHYEMDDFQIQAVTEGTEAMGETIVKLRANGELYSGRGISTDIVGSSIQAYINAVNKIVYQEA